MLCGFCGEPITGTFMSESPRRLADGTSHVDHFHTDQGPYVEALPTCAMQAALAAAHQHLAISTTSDGVFHCHVGRS